MDKIWEETLARMDAIETRLACIDEIVKDYFKPREPLKPTDEPEPETEQNQE